MPCVFERHTFHHGSSAPLDKRSLSLLLDSPRPSALQMLGHGACQRPASRAYLRRQLSNISLAINCQAQIKVSDVGGMRGNGWNATTSSPQYPDHSRRAVYDSNNRADSGQRLAGGSGHAVTRPQPAPASSPQERQHRPTAFRDITAYHIAVTVNSVTEQAADALVVNCPSRSLQSPWGARHLNWYEIRRRDCSRPPAWDGHQLGGDCSWVVQRLRENSVP
jgi:hypothetical protein